VTDSSTSRHIGIFRLRYPVVSETFIREQARSLTRYRPTIITRSRMVDSGEPAAVMTVGGHLPPAATRLARAMYVATASSWLFGPRRTWPPIKLLHAHFGPDATYALPLAERLGVPLITTFHGWDITLPRSSYLTRASLTTWRYVARSAALRRHGTTFIAVSDYIRDCLLAQGYPADRVVRLYVGVDIERFQPMAKRGAVRFVLSVARHTEQKGVATLIRGFARVAATWPDVDLIQVGTGPLTADLKRIAKEHGVAHRVQFVGALSHDAVRALMVRATVVALTSQTPANGQQEALGLVLNEAGACGVPVVATQHGGMPEAVVHGETGLLVPEGDELAVGEALATILGDDSLAARMGARGRTLVSDVFNVRTQTAALEDLYDRVTGSSLAQNIAQHDPRDGAQQRVS
jgi:colanic acid/amylovoran biosynthesis glycosyltransferase